VTRLAIPGHCRAASADELPLLGASSGACKSAAFGALLAPRRAPSWRNGIRPGAAGSTPKIVTQVTDKTSGSPDLVPRSLLQGRLQVCSKAGLGVGVERSEVGSENEY
jgi:hypothetical protein